MATIDKLQEDIKNLESMFRDVSVKMEIEEKRKSLKELLNTESKVLNKNNIQNWIEKNTPFQNKIWKYYVENLYGESAKSWTAFLLKTHNGNKYKLRICIDDYETKKTENLIKKHQISMPEYYGEEKFPECSCFLFKRLDDAKVLNKVDKNIYSDSEWLIEPNEIYKKPAKEMARINIWSNIHKKNKIFMKQVNKWLLTAEKVFSSEKFSQIKYFFDEHFKNNKLRYGSEHWDSHFGNWMIEESNPHKAYAIDEWSIAEDYLIWFGFASFMMKDLKELDIKQQESEKIENFVKKFLKWYYKINPNMKFNRSYFELIYALRALKTIHSRFRDNKLEMTEIAKEKLSNLIEASSNDSDDIYKEKFPILYNFIRVDKKLHM